MPTASPLRSTQKIALFSALALAAGATVMKSSAQVPAAARPPTFTCVFELAYTPAGGSGETYQKVFDITEGKTFTHDFSTPTKQKQFQAKAVKKDGEVYIDFEYFSDVSALTTIDVASTLGMAPGQVRQTTHGHHFVYNSQVGNQVVNYSLRCQQH